MKPMTDATRTTSFRFWLWLIGVIVPRRLRADWRQEWEAELRYRELMLADWDNLNWKNKLNLLRRSVGAFWDALVLQPQRLEDEMFQDLRFGARMLLKHKGFTIVAVLTLALGIGANTAIFSVVQAVLLRALPYSQPEQLVWIWEVCPKDDIKEESASVPNFADWRSQSQSFREMSAFAGTAPVLTNAGEPERIPGTSVTANFFTTLGVQPVIGRSFVAEENTPGKNRVVILSHNLWQRRFSSDPQIIGQKVTLNGNPHEVVGVMPPGFKNPRPEEPRPTELWLPLALDPAQAGRRSDFLRVVARLGPGVSIDQARAEMETITNGLASQYPQTNFGWGVTILPLHERIVGNLRPALWTLMGAVGFLLLIACANVANLLLARAAARQQEIAVRTALGAGRWRLVRQFLTESVLLSLTGGVTGLLVGWWGVKLLIAFSPDNIRRLSEVTLSGPVFAFTSALAILTGVVFGLVPAVHAANPNLNESLKEGGRSATVGARSGRLRSALVVSEIALALVMLVGAGLMTRSFLRLQQVDPGFNPDRVVTALISLPATKYAEGPQITAFYHQLLERVQDTPGVESAALGSGVPLASGSYNTFFIEGRPVPRPEELQPDADYLRVSRDYFAALGIQFIRGENFAERYADGAPGVAIISQSMARKYFPDEDPIGKRITTGNPQPPPGQTVPWQTIIGIVADTPSEQLDAPHYPQLYVLFDQNVQRSLTLIARTSGDPLLAVGALRNATRSLDGDQPLYNIRTMRDLMANSVAAHRFNMVLIGLFAGLGLVLAAVGIYGVISYSVNQRTHEIGIRVALGAGRRDIVRLIVGEGLALTLIGVGLGLTAAFALTRLLAGLLFGVGARDPLTFAGVAALLAVVALLACYVPARRATNVDPMIALRHD